MEERKKNRLLSKLKKYSDLITIDTILAAYFVYSAVREWYLEAPTAYWLALGLLGYAFFVISKLKIEVKSWMKLTEEMRDVMLRQDKLLDRVTGEKTQKDFYVPD